MLKHYLMSHTQTTLQDNLFQMFNNLHSTECIVLQFKDVTAHKPYFDSMDIDGFPGRAFGSSPLTFNRKLRFFCLNIANTHFFYWSLFGKSGPERLSDEKGKEVLRSTGLDRAGVDYNV